MGNIISLGFTEFVQNEQEEQIEGLYEGTFFKVRYSLINFEEYLKIVNMFKSNSHGKNIGNILSFKEELEEGTLIPYKVEYEGEIRGVVVLEGKKIVGECWGGKGEPIHYSRYRNMWVNKYELMLPKIDQVS